jgi:hypothetical protein
MHITSIQIFFLIPLVTWRERINGFWTFSLFQYSEWIQSFWNRICFHPQMKTWEKHYSVSMLQIINSSHRKLVQRDSTYLPTYLPTYLWLYSPLLNLGRFFSFLIFHTLGLLGRRINPSQGLYLHTEQHKHRINAHRHPWSMPWVGLEPSIPAFERANIVHALDREVTVTGSYVTTQLKKRR